MSDLINCPVEFPTGVSKFGVFANAFRVVPEAGQECFIDFCVYSAQEEKAEVIARIRIHRSFLEIIKGRLEMAMEDLTGKSPDKFVVKDGLLKTSQGGVVLFNPGSEEH
jgi:hypothetical protein